MFVCIGKIGKFQFHKTFPISQSTPFQCFVTLTLTLTVVDHYHIHCPTFSLDSPYSSSNLDSPCPVLPSSNLAFHVGHTTASSPPSSSLLLSLTRHSLLSRHPLPLSQAGETIKFIKFLVGILLTSELNTFRFLFYFLVFFTFLDFLFCS